MADKQNDPAPENSESSTARPSPAQVPRQVVVSYLDSPPNLGKRQIHPRRPAPIVPTREQRTSGNSDRDAKSEKPGQ